MAETKRQKLEILRTQLEQERSSFISHWSDISNHVLPRRARFTLSDVNRGERRNLKIIDSTATLAARTLRAGLMGGVTSPARPWFRLSTPDPGMAEFGKVKLWLDTVSKRMSTVFLRSNLYQVLPIVYGDLGVFGTAAMFEEEEFSDNLVRFTAFPIGSYMIANDDAGRVNIFFREFRMTARQIVTRFGKQDRDSLKIDWSNISTSVKSAWENNNKETWFDICHVLYPNDEYDPSRIESKYNKRFASCYYEKGSGEDKYLSESGYERFRVMAPRWEVTGEDCYGTECPGMTTLGDVKQLQIGERRSAQAIEKMINPPMKGPSALLHKNRSILPGDFTADDSREGQPGFRPVHEVNIRIQELEAKQEQIRQRIKRGYYEDLFLMLASSDRRDITATEIMERKEEKLLALGSVLEQLNQDLLDPLIDNTFDIMLARSVDARGKFMDGAIIPQPPEELSGVTLKVEYISVMAQAQKLVGISGMERFMSFAVQVAQTDPTVFDKIDTAQVIDSYADITGIPANLIRPDEQVAEIQKQRQQAAAAQAQAEMENQQAQTAKNLSQAKTGEDNALTRMLEQANAGSLVEQNQ